MPLLVRQIAWIKNTFHNLGGIFLTAMQFWKFIKAHWSPLFGWLYITINCFYFSLDANVTSSRDL